MYNFAEGKSVNGQKHDFFPLAIGISGKVTFWLPAVIAIDEKPLVPFIDPRRSSKRLTSEGRRFVFSVMHERIRAADPDFGEVELGIIQFGAKDDGSRVPNLFIAKEIELYDFDTIDAMVQETYAIWQEVLEEREAEVRRKGSGGRGTLI